MNTRTTLSANLSSRSTTPRRRVVASLLLAVLFAPGHTAAAADFLGAGPVLRKVEEQTAKKPDGEAKPDENTKLREALSDFGQKVASLAPAAAAQGWLELVDRRGKLPPTGNRGFDGSVVPVTAQELVAVMPPPTAWGELTKAIAARPAAKGRQEMVEIGLRLLAATLAGDVTARTREIAALQVRAGKAEAREVYFYRRVLEQISEALLSALDDPEAVLQSLERRLESGSEHGMNQLRLPNLVSLVGTAKTEVFLRRALQQENIVIAIEGQNDTARLAQKLALEMIDLLKKPQWGLVNSLDAVALYEALEKRFDQEKEKPRAAATPALIVLPDLSALPDSGGDYQKVQAQTYYLLGLISKERAQDAVAVARKLGKKNGVYVPHEAMKALERAGYTKALDDFFFELLSQDPALPFWNEYVQLAAKAGQTDRMLKLARAAAAREDLSKTKKVVIHQTLYRALLAAEQVEEGVQEMRRLMSLDDKADRSQREETPGQLGLMLARLGMLLQKPEWTEEGVRVAKKSLEASEEPRANVWANESVFGPLASLLLELKRGPEAEAILSEVLTKATRTAAARGEQSSWDGNSPGRQALLALATLYHKAGRPADVLALLDQAPYWKAKDLKDLTAGLTGYDGMQSLARVHLPGTKLPLGYLAASALAGTGRKAEARKIVDAELDREPGLDRAYELLLELGDDTTLARLDELFARDQFEERPLIWKAELLRRQNKLDDAEKIARQAISIDPSDGEQGPGDRLRAYAVLAEVRAARGDQKEADFLRGAIRAIRLSEQADQFYAAGLLKRAIQMYEDSLKLFADAYCIQSRLAVQLAELGRHEEAEAHYRRAYELMPGSFGRVESHCFGCERAFEGQRAQSLAEKIFSELAVKTPDKPQVHYLLGYLREEQERHGDALPHFQTAVKLDPEYLNAWQKISSLSEHVRLPIKERDLVAFNILRLDPLQRHAQVAFAKVSDLAGLWNVLAAGQKRQPAPPVAVYPLAASKAALEQREKEQKDPRQRYREIYQRTYSGLRLTSPAAAVAQTPFVRVAAELFAGNGADLFDE